MKVKHNNKKSILKNTIYFLIFITSILCVVIFYDKYFLKNKVFAKDVNANIEKAKISNAKAIQIEEIIPETVESQQQEEYYIEEIDLEYITKYRNNPNLPKDTIQVIQEGREGKQQITNKKTYKNGEVIKEEQISTKITKATIDKIVEIGTGSSKNTYKVKVGDNLYVTSDRLAVMSESNEQSIKITTLNNGDKLKLLEIQENWYKISCNSVIGYVKAEATKAENKEENDNIRKSKTKEELNSILSFNMQLNQPSGLTLEQFKKVLSDQKDVNKIFEQNAEYFYYIEKQYNINGIFVAAIGIHESAWGTSKLAKEKNNLFGYGAYDSNPYNGAYSFTNYSESIDLLARVLVKYYLNPEGTSIYGNEKAIGTYYNGTTIRCVNTKYASDKQWAEKIYYYMKYLYNKL